MTIKQKELHELFTKWGELAAAKGIPGEVWSLAYAGLSAEAIRYGLCVSDWIAVNNMFEIATKLNREEPHGVVFAKIREALEALGVKVDYEEE